MELPNLYVETQPESQKRSKIAIAVMVLLLLAMPLGVFLTLRSQNTTSQADTPDPVVIAENSIALVSRTSSVNNQAVFPVDVIIRSDTASSNLIATTIKFPTDSLEVVSIASSSADLTDTSRLYPATEWLDASFNNEEGQINLVAGIPQVGLQTNPNLPEQSVLATIYFKAKRGGTDVDILFQEGSMMLATETTQNQLSSAKSLSLKINDTSGDFTDQTYRTQADQFKNTASSSASFRIQTPNGGEVFPYLSPVNISWARNEATGAARTRSQNNQQTQISLAIFMNNQFLGILATDLPDNGSYLWNPSSTLPQTFIKPENSFKIEIEKKSAQLSEKVLSAGPFNLTLQNSTSVILLTPEALTVDKLDQNSDTVVDYKDASVILKNYLAPVTQQNLKTDFNNDRIINALDLWYLNQHLNK